MKLFGLGKKVRDGEFEYKADHRFAAQHELLARYVAEALGSEPRYYVEFPLKDSEAGKEILKLSPELMCGFVMATLEHLEHSDAAYLRMQKQRTPHTTAHPAYKTRSALFYVMRAALRRKLPFPDEQIQFLLDRLEADLRPGASYHWLPAAGIVKALKDFTDRGKSVETVSATAQRIVLKMAEHPARDVQKMGEKILSSLGMAPDLPIHPGEAWADVGINHIARAGEKEKAAWGTLIAMCTSVNGGKPSKKWSKTAEECIAASGLKKFAAVVPEWFLLVDKPRTQPITDWPRWAPDPNALVDDGNADILKGLVWTSGITGESSIADSIGKLALSAYRKVPGVGPRATKVGNACVWALGQIPGESSLAALAILKVRVKYRPAQKGIAAALAEAAERAGMTPEELEEIGVPDYGMQDVGIRKETLGEHEAVLRVASAKKVELTWTNAAGKALKTVPKAVRDNHAEELKDLRQAGKDILKMLSAQRDRLDNLFLDQRVWAYKDWVQRYVEHPLVGTMGQRLIWTFEIDGKSVAGIWSGDRLVGADGKELEGVTQSSAVRLWHPVGEDVDAIVAWRSWVESNEITQPFKQAHREIYLLTDAERTTELYSNRYASHIVKQHQFNALCAARGWRHSLRLMVDDEYEPPTKLLPQWELRAEFWVEGIGTDFGTDTTEAGSYLYLATDQVRFYRDEAASNSAHAGGGGYRSHGTDNDANTPLPLRAIDPLALSEIFRDVDLFVGVASVGNDPNWSDGGPEGRFVDYWNSYSFGELNESAKTRKVLLENLIPRLKIRDRCEVTDRFLRVKGDIRSYKIHLGSGNVLMDPSDQYLCIVAAQGKAAKANSIFLPFEGDNRMSVILSKAFLLAEDTKITDRTILSQI